MADYPVEGLPKGGLCGCPLLLTIGVQDVLIAYSASCDVPFGACCQEV